MSKRLSFRTADGHLIVEFDGKPIPAEKLDGLFSILTADVDRSAKSLQELYDITQPENENV